MHRFISESGRLISDNLEMTDVLNMEGYHLTTDIKEGSDWTEHHFFYLLF